LKLKYSVQLTKSAAKEFKKLPNTIKKKVLEAFHFLSQNPYSEILKVKKMKGPIALFRIRIGDYRIVYEIVDKKLIVVIIKIGHRKEVYQKLC
jgi:mRNA interferase RelE/StbE